MGRTTTGRGIVHRLDRDTSGLLVAARSPEAHELLQELIRTRGLERTYAALVRGAPRSASGRIEAPIGRDRRDRTRHSLDTATPRDAVTWFEVREPMPHHALLDVRLETGRTHQIRVHLRPSTCPSAAIPCTGSRRDLGLERQFLHARRLRFTHPLTQAEIDVASELPGDSQKHSRGRGGTALRCLAEAGLLPPGFSQAGGRCRYMPRVTFRLPGEPRPGGGAEALRGPEPGSVPGPPEHRQSKTTPRGAGTIGSRLHEGASGSNTY